MILYTKDKYFVLAFMIAVMLFSVNGAFAFSTGGTFEPTIGNHTFTVDAPPIEINTDALFEVSTLGDFGVQLDWYVDNFGYEDIHIGPNETIQWTIPFDDMSSILSDDKFLVSFNIDKTYNNNLGSDWSQWEEGPSSNVYIYWKVSYAENTAPVPEPATIVLMGIGLAALGFTCRARARKP